MDMTDIIRYRLKSDGKVYVCRQSCLREDGILEHKKKKYYGGDELDWEFETVYLDADEYEIIPEHDIWEFRRQSAKDVLCSLIISDRHLNDDDIVNKVIELTDKLIEKL